MARDEARIADVRAWLTRAAADLRAAEHDRTAGVSLLGDAVFHTQQAVEKALKGFLAWHDRPFRKTHDLVEVGRLCVEIDGSLDGLLKRAAGLTEYAWKFRYPGEPEEPSQEEAQQALKMAREVWQAVLERLPEEVRPNR